MRKTLLCLIGCAVFLMGAAPALPPLVNAARNLDTGGVRALLAKGADPNEAAADGTTALHWAAYRDDAEIARLLLAARANVNAANDLGATALWAASQNRSAAMTRLLLDAGANPNLALSSGETPLMMAARTGSPDVARLLLGKGANPNTRGTRGQTALMWAVAQHHPDVVAVLIAGDADIHLRSDSWSQVMAVPPHSHPEYNRAIPHGGNTALLFAARDGDLASARLLVAAGADVNDTDAWGVSATVLAAHSGYWDLMEFLLQKGANPDLDRAGFSALHLAVMRRSERAVQVLLKHGANPNVRLRTWTPTRRASSDWHFPPELIGATPFWLAARFTQPNLMRLLVEHGADPRFVHRVDYMAVAGFGAAPRTEATTALMAALGMGGGVAWVEINPDERATLTLDTVRLLVEFGVDVNFADPSGRMALDAATSLKHEPVVKFLVEKGARRSEKPAQ